MAANNPAPTQRKLDLTDEQIEMRLKFFIDGGDILTAQEIIDSNGLPYLIENGRLQLMLKGTELHLKHFITADPEMLQLKDDVRRLSAVDDSVLIYGQTGTGKEIIARALMGDRKGNFIIANCGGMPEYLIESELFGYVKGAFTGATMDRPGMCKMAENGVLFMDEIGELPIHVQAKLLRMIQEKCIRKVGASAEEKVEGVRFVFATNKNLPEMVKEGKFREDLYARISTFELVVTTLAKRAKTDVPAIAETLEGGKEWLAALEKADINVTELDLQFNVRSLQRYIRRFKVQGRVSKY